MSTDAFSGQLTIAEQLYEVLEKHYGSRPTELTPLPFGIVNYVFRATLGGRSFIVKTPRLDNAGRCSDVHLNKFCAEMLRPLGVPAPETIFIDSTWNMPLCGIEECLPGINALALGWQVLRRSFRCYLPQLAELMGKVHSRTIDGFGRLDAAGKGQLRNWEAVLTSPLTTVRDSVEHIADKTIISHELMRKCCALLERLSSRISLDRAQLLHGDLVPNNILVAEGAICGILDWGDALGGDPLYDLVLFEFFCGSTPFKHLLGAYEQHLPTGYALDLSRLDCYRLSIAMGKLGWRSFCKRKDLLLHPANVLKRILRKHQL